MEVLYGAENLRKRYRRRCQWAVPPVCISRYLVYFPMISTTSPMYIRWGSSVV